jgi:hypothetical protein
MALHKVEVSVETLVSGMVCVTDTRASSKNMGSNALISSCDPNGQVTACFSALTNPNTKLYLDGTPVNGDTKFEGGQIISTAESKTKLNLDPAAAFSLAIGCQGAGCINSDYSIFYRVRVSKQTWANTENSVTNLDMWCMNMSQRNKVVDPAAGGVIASFVKTNLKDDPFDDSLNLVPQMYPSDLYMGVKPLGFDRSPAANGAGNNFIGGNTENSAATIGMVAALLLPLLALLL